MLLRDIALTLLILAALPISVARPFLGVLFFAWISIMNPHRLTWGFASSFSWAQYIAVATLIGFLATQERQFTESFRQYRYAILYLLWTAVTTAFAFSFSDSLVRLIEFTKVQLMCLITLALLNSRKRIEIFLAVALLSIAFYGIKGGLFTLRTGGSSMVWGPPGSVIADNNQLATALTMCVPLLFWLAQWVKIAWVRYLVYASSALCVISIFGSHSRGAFLASIAMGLFLIFKSHYKVIAFIFVAAMIIAVPMFMPESYWERISSIMDYETDNSAQGRLEMWASALKVANSRLTGGGFDVYRAQEFWNYVVTKPRSSHSIYFQTLGDHGWVGFGLYLVFWTSIWLQCRASIKTLKRAGAPPDQVLMPRMIQVSLVGYAVGGAFVNISYWDFPFYLAVVVLAVRRLEHGSVAANRPTASIQARMPLPESPRASLR